MNTNDRGIAAASPPPPLLTDHPLHPRSPGTGRYHGLDVIRATMMLLGVVIHTALVYHERVVAPAHLARDAHRARALGLARSHDVDATCTRCTRAGGNGTCCIQGRSWSWDAS